MSLIMQTDGWKVMSKCGKFLLLQGDDFTRALASWLDQGDEFDSKQEQE